MLDRRLHRTAQLLLVAGVAGLFLPWLTGLLSASEGLPGWLLDLFVHWQAVYLLMLVSGALLAAARHVAYLLLLLLLPLPFLTALEPAPRSYESGLSIKIVTANIQVTNTDLSRLKALIDSEKPSLVVLVEVSEKAAAELGQLADYPFQTFYPEAGPFGFGLLSKLPLNDTRLIKPAAAEPAVPYLQTRIDWQGSTINLIAFHPMPPLTPAFHAQRNRTLQVIVEESVRAGMATVIAGDFNASPWSLAFGPMVDNGYRRATGLQATWPVRWLGIPLDQVLVSPHWGVYDRHVGPDIGSDHLPVVVTLNGEGIAAEPESLLESLGIELTE